MSALIDQLAALLNGGAVQIFGSPATYQAPGSGSGVVPITGIILESGLPESTAPGYYCDFFVTVGTGPGSLPVPPVRQAHVILAGATYYVGDIPKADKNGNGFRLALHKDFS